jgi:hypothetical protein
MDVSKHKTSMQKEIDGNRQKYLSEEEKKKEALKEQQAIEEAEDEESDGEEPRPTKQVRPKFKVVHSYPVDI